MYEKAQHGIASSTTKTMKMKPKFSERKKNPRPLSCNNFLPDWNTLHRSKIRTKNSRASLSASYAARPSRDYLATGSVRVELSSLSATVTPVARLA